MRRFITSLIIAMLLLSVGASAAITNPNYSYTDEQRIYPFWKQDTMYNEYVSFMETDEGIYGTTLFVPSEIICVTDSGNQTEYYEGIDFHWIKGTNRIEWISGSSIPYFYYGAINGKASPDSDELIPEGSKNTDEYGRYRSGNTLICSSSFLYSRQFCVTYKYDMSQIESHAIQYTEYQGDKLSRTESKLHSGEDLNVLFYGDSIFAGGDSSSHNKREPYMPSMSKLIEAELQNNTSGKVNLDNLSVGGWSTQNGLSALSGAVGGVDYSDSYEGYDLLILSFGMNDTNTPVADVKASFEGIISAIQDKNPNIEIILVSCMSPNPDSGFYGNQQYFGAMLKSLADADSHTAFVDMFSIHTAILGYKSFTSTTGNGVNHPNDWLIRIYAQNILSSIIQYKTQTDNSRLNLFQRIMQYIQNIILRMKRFFVIPESV